jgi:hypothetical protein
MLWACGEAAYHDGKWQHSKTTYLISQKEKGKRKRPVFHNTTPPTVQGPLTRPYLLKFPPPPNSATLETNPLTHGPLEKTHPKHNIAAIKFIFLPSKTASLFHGNI